MIVQRDDEAKEWAEQREDVHELIKIGIVPIGSALRPLSEKLKDHEARHYDRPPAEVKKRICADPPGSGYFVMGEVPAIGPRAKGFKIRCFDAKYPNGQQNHVVRHYPSQRGWAGGDFLDDSRSGSGSSGVVFGVP